MADRSPLEKYLKRDGSEGRRNVAIQVSSTPTLAWFFVMGRTLSLAQSMTSLNHIWKLLKEGPVQLFFHVACATLRWSYLGIKVAWSDDIKIFQN